MSEEILNFIKEIMLNYPQSHIKCSFSKTLELILCDKGNVWISLEKIKTIDDLKSELIEWTIRNCCKTEPYKNQSRNIDLQNKLLMSLNRTLCTNFNREEAMKIYSVLGNGVNHQLTLEFIKSGYDLGVLKDE